MICAASELIETSIVFVKSSDDDAFSPKQLTLICVDGKYGAWESGGRLQVASEFDRAAMQDNFWEIAAQALFKLLRAAAMLEVMLDSSNK